MMRLCCSVLVIFSVLLWSGCKEDDDNGGGTDLSVITVGGQSIPEGDSGVTTVNLTVRLDKESAQTVRVDYATREGSAEAVADFLPVEDARLTFLAGETEKDISFSIVADQWPEEDESFTVEFRNPQNATLGVSEVEISITNDDSATDDPFGIPDEGYTGAESYPGYTLVWEEEFEGTSLNEDNWTYEIGTGNNGWGNNELQYYREENTQLFDGTLVVEAKRENFGNREYTSSRLVTLGKQSFKYGRIDIRAALPQGQGIWPALWMLGENINQVGWPACGEIDIMELVGHEPNKVHGTVHFGNDFSQHQYQGQSTTLSEGIFADEFHLFSIIWEENNIQWLVDDEPYFEFNSTQTGSQPWPFNNEFFFIINVAVGGNWPGSPNATTQFPQYMFVDYIRVFQ